MSLVAWIIIGVIVGAGVVIAGVYGIFDDIPASLLSLGGILLIAGLGIMSFVACVQQKSEEREKNVRKEEFSKLVNKFSSDLASLEKTLEASCEIDENTRIQIIQSVRQIETNFTVIVKTFTKVEEDAKSKGQDDIRFLWMMDNLRQQSESRTYDRRGVW